MCQSAPAPAAPDPVATANAQAVMNQDTATTQQLLNQTNQVTPQGTLNYNQTGSNSFTDASGKTVNVPQFTATTTLSPAEQDIFNTNEGTKQNIATIGQNQSAKIGDLLGTPFSVDQSIADKIDQLGATRLDPQWAASQEALNSKLANSGIQPGSAAWDAEQRSFGRSKNDAYNSLYLSGDAQAEQESLANRNQPINEITALMSGSQVSNPTFASTPQTNVGGVDYMGQVNQSYTDAYQQQQMQNSNNQAMMGGLFGLGGAAITGGASLMKPAPTTNFNFG